MPIMQNKWIQFLPADSIYVSTHIRSVRFMNKKHMTDALPDFSSSQWDFLAVMEAFGGRVSIDIVGALVSLPLGQVLDLLRQCENRGWITQTTDGQFGLSTSVPTKVISRLKTINTPARVSSFVELLRSKKLFDKLEPKIRLELLFRAGRSEKAVREEVSLVLKAMQEGDEEEISRSLDRLLPRLALVFDVIGNETWLISTALKLSTLCVAKGKGFSQLIDFLGKVLELTERIGDRRSWGIIKNHLGRLFLISGREQEALEALREGKERIEELGDPDILTQSAEFLGFYYFYCGVYSKAIKHFEAAVTAAEGTETFYINPLSAIFLGICEAYLGQFHRAIGTFDYHRRVAQQEGDISKEAFCREALAYTLLLIKKRDQARKNYEYAYQQAKASDNTLVLVSCLIGLSVINMQEGFIHEGLEFLKKFLDKSRSSGIAGEAWIPTYLEHFFDFERATSDLPPGFRFEEVFRKIMSGPNVYFKGIGLRLKAMRAIFTGGDTGEIWQDLVNSKKYLKRSGVPVQEAKTLLEMARFKLKQGNKQESRRLAYKARQELSSYWEIFFPDDLRFLLDSSLFPVEQYGSSEDIWGPFLQMLEDLIPKPTMDDALKSLLSALCRFVRAERAAFFSFKDETGESPTLRISSNLSKTEVMGEDFRSNLALVFSCFREKKPKVIQRGSGEYKSKYRNVLAILCIPLTIKNEISGVFYFDNSYLEDCFEFVKQPLLKNLENHLITYFERILQYEQMNEEANEAAFRKTAQMNHHEHLEFLAESPVMTKTLAQAKRMAKSGAPILILGETGVGKELMARWMHKNSPFSEAPFVVVDPTSIPETLLESELFGHEKGAFTGADRQKIGRIELAHRGTLFIDEIGEIPERIQVKLLRFLQEKTFFRVGGTQTIESDFRLLAATNRDLPKEVADGRFRQDLYYRINVLVMNIPPLRKRPKDIIALANHFLEHYCKRYNHQVPHLSNEQEKQLMDYHWPGNVRELKNIVERAVLISEGNNLGFEFPGKSYSVSLNPFQDDPTLEEVQRRYIRYVFEQTGNRVGGPGGAAEILGMKRTSLYTRMKKLGMR